MIKYIRGMVNGGSISTVMKTELPPKVYQREKRFRPDAKLVNVVYEMLNFQLFNSTLTRPQIILRQHRNQFGQTLCYTQRVRRGTDCVIDISDKWYCVQWLIAVLSHEMIHQYQWDLRQYSEIDFHGSTFYEWSTKFSEHDIPLSSTYDGDYWLSHQKFKEQV